MKWEYYWIPFSFDKDSMDKVDELGQKGWELVTIVPVHKGMLEHAAVMKKRKL